MKNVIGLFILLFFTPVLSADGFNWLTSTGEKAPEKENQKRNAGFGGVLLITPDKDWQEKWNTPKEHVPYFSEAKNVKVGDELTILLFLQTLS